MKRRKIISWLAWILMTVAAILMAVALLTDNAPGDTDAAARRMGSAVSERMAVLEGFIDRALESDPDAWMDLEGLPRDMVVYRYTDDSLTAWRHQFTVLSDDISPQNRMRNLNNLQNVMRSPLTDVSEQVRFQNFGPRWYLAESRTAGRIKVIAGLEILNTATFGGINPALHPDKRFSIKPLSEAGGSAVSLNGQPVFKLMDDVLQEDPVLPYSELIWLALGLYLLASYLLLTARHNLRTYLILMGLLAFFMSSFYLWGRTLKGSTPLFSPALYADGALMDSLGTLLIVNLSLFMGVLYTYAIRMDIFRRLYGKGKGTDACFVGGVTIVLLSILVHVHRSLRSIIMNSNICLELYKFDRLTPWSGMVLLSLMLLLLCIPLLLQLMGPVIRSRTGWRFDALSRPARVVFAALASVYLVAATATLGLRKEENTVKIWATRLAMDRDITLEIQLRQVEEAIARDPVIASLSALDNSAGIILNRLSENYLVRVAQNNDITVSVTDGSTLSPGLRAYIQDRIGDGTPISSYFYYSRNNNGQGRYTGRFYFYNRRYGGSSILVGVEPKSNREDRGYASLLGYSAPGQVILPARYAYAKYVNGHLATFKGNFDDKHYTRFVNEITDDETIIISRPKIEASNYLVSIFFLLLLFYVLTYFMTWSHRRRSQLFEQNYYKSRINFVLLASLVLTLIVMAVISVLFVNRRNDANLKTMMSDKINAIQTLVQMRSRFVKDFSDLPAQEVAGILDDAGSVTKTDITLYSTAGRLLRSTTPEIFDRMLLGTRMRGDAYRNIVHEHMRYWIHKERFGKQSCYFMYAPIFNGDGDMIAILGAPYNDKNYDFETEAVLHSVSIFTLFFMLLILARFTIARVVDKMFRPLVEMGRKMNETDLNHPEYIVYERDDEISSLVRAYNLMVHDLYDSTRQLTQAERDKAWATMARQVAHEIKNPLTPIKLQIQQLIRLKTNGNPVWEDRFDNVSKEVLAQIDILAETASEFSTFAKLYTEDPVEFDLDKLLKEEIGLFDSRDDIELSYMGLEGTLIHGPKPQLTRVFVNLMSNAIQAVESRLESGEGDPRGHVLVSLRHSTKDGFYDIVVEDDGPGVDDENRSRLFTPNFTTKSKGTGLGLAISRSILEKCNAEISYSKSFNLGGACFTVRYPKGA